MRELTEETRQDLDRELQKALSTLRVVDKYLSSMNESNAALHCSSSILYSPLTMRVRTSIMELEMLSSRIDGGPDIYG